MTIDINGLPPPGAKRADSETPATTERRTPDTAETDRHRRSPTDAVSLTDIGTRLREVEKKLAELPVVDAQRVDEVKKALSEGTYRPDLDKVASKMLQFEHLLDRE